MTRLTTVAACLVASALATSAYAQSQAEIAKKLNEEGKTLMFANKYDEASAKFRAAVARVPEPGYFINLCTSLFHEGKFGEAITACNAVANNSPTPDQRAKADKLTTRIKDEAKAQGISAEALGGGSSPDDPEVDCTATPDDPRCEQVAPPPDRCKANPRDPACRPGDPHHGGTGQPPHPPPHYAVGRPPTGTGLFMSTTPDNKYTWTLGFELFGGGGAVGRDRYYGSAATGFRLKGDYLLNPRSRLGAQGYLQYTHFGPGEMDSLAVTTLDIIDLGVAAYKHLCPRGAQRLCLTPLVGVQLAMMSPAGEEDPFGDQIFNYAALGGRLELGAHFALGSRMEHVIGVTAGLNVYTPVFSGPTDSFDGPSIEMAGLDAGGAAAYIGIGYTYRFRTPLGSSPFITLE
jgi:hypothetical protein